MSTHADEILKRLPDGECRMVEIGVAAGELSAEILRRHHGVRMRLVDPYRWHPDTSPYRQWCQQYGDPSGAWSKDQVHANLRAVTEIIRRWPGRVRLEICESVKDAQSQHREREQFDLVYIDGDHREAAVRADIAAWWPFVKPGGYIGGHDYGRFRDDGVGIAVRAFALETGLDLEATGGEPWTWFVRRPS